MENTINGHRFDEKQELTLNDLQENGKEKISTLSDEELQELKKQALEAEDYDICKLIKQEQTERAERAKETGEGMKEEEDLQELEEQTRREEEWKKGNEQIQQEKELSHEENLKKVDGLITQLNNGEKIQESEDSQELDWQAKREEAWKDINERIQKEKTQSPEIKEENENRLNEISDKELLGTEQIIHEITERRYRGDSRILQKIRKYYPTEENIPGLRKHIQEHPEDGITDKASYYTKKLEEITDLIKDSIKEYNSRGIMIGDTKTLEEIMNGIHFIGKNLKEAGMEESPQFEKVKSIYKYFLKEKELIEGHLNRPIPSYRYRR